MKKLPTICPVCKEGRDFKFIQDYKNKGGEWSLYQCSECEAQFWMPFKNPGVDWYEDKNDYENAYLIRGAEKEAKTAKIGKPIISKEHKEFIENVKNYSRGTKVLDLGCGTSDVIAELRKRGYEVWGIDFNRNAINFVKDCFKLENVYAMSFDEFFKLPNLPKFDIIIFFDVIEHLDNPLTFIRNAVKLLKGNGVIVLKTPSRERILPSISDWDFPPGHLTRWNEKAISNLFKKLNLKIVRIDYIEQSELILNSLAEKYRLNLVVKTIKISKNKEIGILTKIVHLGAYFKDNLLFGIPAAVLFLISKITKYKNGRMLIWLKREEILKNNY